MLYSEWLTLAEAAPSTDIQREFSKLILEQIRVIRDRMKLGYSEDEHTEF